MKTFKNQAAQGDVFIRRIDKIPENAKPEKTINGCFVVAHSETGHSHVIAERPGVEYFGTDDPMTAYLRVIEDVEVTMEHLRSFDTHEALLIPGGTYEIRRQREYTPQGWRRVAD
ncbi:MAG: hypothetical protein M0Z85_10330 [Gammaproteobacteria bacterium]|nr:hypothetical protein [Gammaproteobacteria bacterium]